jgi:hypothetical protein
VDRFGRKYLASAARYRRIKNGIYILTEEKDGRYIFRLIKPLQRNV